MQGRLIRSIKKHLPLSQLRRHAHRGAADDRSRTWSALSCARCATARTASSTRTSTACSSAAPRASRPTRETIASPRRRLERAARAAGFREVHFLRGAHRGRARLSRPAALRARPCWSTDFGGGTSDFTVIRHAAATPRRRCSRWAACRSRATRSTPPSCAARSRATSAPTSRTRVPMSTNVLRMPPALDGEDLHAGGRVAPAGSGCAPLPAQRAGLGARTRRIAPRSIASSASSRTRWASRSSSRSKRAKKDLSTAPRADFSFEYPTDRAPRAGHARGLRALQRDGRSTPSWRSWTRRSASRACGPRTSISCARPAERRACRGSPRRWRSASARRSCTSSRTSTPSSRGSPEEARSLA